MTSAPARVGLVGFGVAGSAFHAPLVAATPGLELAAIVTRDEVRRALAAQRHPGALLLRSTDDLWRLAGDGGLDLVVVASPNSTHVPLALEAVAAGLPVVVDKPVAASVADATRLADAAAAAGVAVTVYQNRRWDGDFRTVQRLLREERLGRVHRFESRFERWRPEVRPGWKERPDPQEAGGILYDLGSHLVDQALMLFGPVESVYAEIATRRPGALVPDDAFVALTHRGGPVSHLWMSAVAADLGPRLRVLGSEAAYVKHGTDVQEAALRAGARPTDPGFGQEPPQAWGLLGRPGATEPVPTERGCYAAFYAQVEKHLRSGAPLPVDLPQAVEGLRVLEMARRSAAEGSIVSGSG